MVARLLLSLKAEHDMNTYHCGMCSDTYVPMRVKLVRLQQYSLVASQLQDIIARLRQRHSSDGEITVSKLPIVYYF